MVAAGLIPPSVVTPIPNAWVRRMGYGPVHFTIDDAMSMVEQGIIPEDATVELLNGALVYRDRFDLRGSEVVEGLKHDFVIGALSDLSGRINIDTRHLRTEKTLVCSETHSPIPDGMVLRGNRLAYRDRRATAADAFCVIEVADSSYERDAGEKLIAYAKAGIEQYVIINLRSPTAEVYTHPDRGAGTYPPAAIVSEAATLALRVGEDEFFTITLSEILP